MKQRTITLKALANLPQILIDARCHQGITQRQLAERLGLKMQQVSRWEKQRYEHIVFHNLVAVTKALNIEITLAGIYG